MRRILKWLGILAGGLLGLIVVITAAVYVITGDRLNRNYDVNLVQIDIPDQVTTDRNDWPLILVDFCEDCHGPVLSGQIMEDDPLFGTLAAANLTPGDGGTGQTFSDADYVRAIRHGIDPDGNGLLVMPSQFFNQLSEDDLGEIIAYVKNLRPVDNQVVEPRLGPLGRIFFAAGQIPDLIPAEIIDHDAPLPIPPDPGATVEYGEYLSFVCEVCHIDDLSGGPGAGEGMNLTPGGQLATWTEEDFVKTMRTGVAPDGEELKEEEMPWRTFAKMSDMELEAIWLYLQSVPAIETEHR